MFGFVVANPEELTKEQKDRYTAVYCGICRNIRTCASNASRLGLSYDMVFLALVLMSLYEPEEISGGKACSLHPIHPRPWVENEFTQYAAEMNVALAYYNAMDDWQDDKSLAGRSLAAVLRPHLEPIRQHWPRQCAAIETCLKNLSQLEKENCANPDAPAGCFGQLMGELFVCREDLWRDCLYQMGFSLGRFVYLTDAAVDFRKDVRKQKYNPFAAMGHEENQALWEQYLVLAMARCTDYYERLPLVQDKALMDNIVYSGVWGNYRRKQKSQEEENDR